MDGKPRVGFIGLGDMGAPIARRITDAGFPTVLWARRPATLEPFEDLRAAGAVQFAANPAALAARVDLVGLCVFGDADVQELAGGPDGLLGVMRPGSLLVVHSTVSAGRCRALAAEGGDRDIAVLDAPVSGGHAAAAAGTLAIMVGGPVAAYERAQPVFSSYGAVIRHMGSAGAGQIMKLINNVVHIANAQLSWVAIELGHRLGLERAALVDVLRTGSASNQGLEVLVTAMARDPEVARHILAMQRKDIALFSDLRSAAGLPDSDLERFVRARLGRAVADVVLP